MRTGRIHPVSWLLFWIAERVFRLIHPPLIRLSHLFPVLKRGFKRAFYDCLSAELQRSGEDGIRFLNYGYASPEGRPLPFRLEENDREEYPFSWNLVYKTVAPGQVSGSAVLVVGCGRGGDAYFIRRYLGAASVIGVDLSRTSIQACRRAYSIPGLEFAVAEAARLRFPAGSFDAVVSIESSHGYPDLGGFYREVRRVLKPGGAFLYCDYFWDETFRRRLSAAGLEVREEEEITDRVLQACREGQAFREALIARLAPPSLHGMFGQLCGFPGSAIYRSLEQRTCSYYRFLLRPAVIAKPGQMCYALATSTKVGLRAPGTESTSYSA